MFYFIRVFLVWDLVFKVEERIRSPCVLILFKDIV